MVVRILKLNYVEHISEVVSDSDYVLLLQYIKELKPKKIPILTNQRKIDYDEFNRLDNT